MGNSTSCGQGTHKVGDECVPSETLACGAGTQRRGDACVPSETLACGAGTRRKGDACIPSETLACGTGTMRKGDACVPSETLACGAGTQRKGDACVPEASVCGAGTSLVNGKCSLAQPETKTCWTNTNCSGFLGLDPCTNSSGVGPGQNLCTYCPGAGQKCQLSMR